eukprot:scaffold7349_cov173-Amphora_coffeaeformis.AAC.74
MPPSNKPMTLRQLNSYAYGNQSNDDGRMPSTDDNADAIAGGTTRSDMGLHEIYHIPTLPGADQARQMLERVVNEFRPIAKRRGYVILSVSELCCCNDGLDFRDKNGKKPRKLSKVSANVLGYNRTMSRNGEKTHTIHLRLRHAQNHNRFFPYEDVAGTLAHELSHCEHGPHNEHFYKLMDSILDEHASLMASGSGFAGGPTGSMGASNFTPFEGQGRTLGGGSQGVSQETPQALLGRGHTLGGDSSFIKFMSPREAAVAAAMARQWQQQLRLRGNRCCRPCVISNEDDDEVQIIDVVPKTAAAVNGTVTAPRRKRAPKVASDAENEQPWKRNTSSNVIDLTTDDAKPAAKPFAAAQWACSKCTFLNAPTTATACEICLAPKA